MSGGTLAASRRVSHVLLKRRFTVMSGIGRAIGDAVAREYKGTARGQVVLRGVGKMEADRGGHGMPQRLEATAET